MKFKRSKHRLMRSAILSFLLYNSSLQPIAPLYAKGIMTAIASVGVLTTLFQHWFIAMFWGYQLKQEIEKEGFSLPQLTLKEQLEGLCKFKHGLKEFDIHDPVALFKANIDDIKHIFKELEIKDPVKFFQEKAEQIETLLQKLEMRLPLTKESDPLVTAKKLQHLLAIENPVIFLKKNLATIKAGLALLDNPKEYALLKTARLLESFKKVLAAIELQGAPSRITALEKIAAAQRTEKNTQDLLRCYELLKCEKEKQHAALEQAKKRVAELEAIAQAQRTKEHDEELLQCYELLQRESDKQLAFLRRQASDAKEQSSWLQNLGKVLLNGVEVQPNPTEQPALPPQPLIDLEIEAQNKKDAANQQAAAKEKGFLSILTAFLFPSIAPAALPAQPTTQALIIAEVAKKEDADSMQEEIKKEVLKALGKMPRAFCKGFFEEESKKHGAHIDQLQHALKPNIIDPKTVAISPAVLPLPTPHSNPAGAQSPITPQNMQHTPYPTPAPLPYTHNPYCVACLPSYTPQSASTALIKAH